MSEFRPGRFEILPLVIKNLMIINGLVFLAQNALGPDFGEKINEIFALHYWGSSLFKPHQLITHLFMHGSVGHLFMNMFTLWMFGSTLENIWGPKRFLIFYMVCGIGAALFYLGVLTYENTRLTHDIQAFLAHPSATNFAVLQKRYDLALDQYELGYPTTPGELNYARFFLSKYLQLNIDNAILGASGAVYGLLFAFGYLFPNNLIYLYFLFPIKAKYLIGILIIMELVLGVQNSAGDNVAHFAHLGGVLFSYILLKVWNRKNRRHFY
ncbi:rhomboid family intramembrane serine protease [Chitinophaga tropicalis]|uniref:Rhomboid family intramembrane serine protease n=1 Tax=Chitinophaga tropicalis TaxID=2683588 RepID=A0A7K1TYQ9_9BACT|nr:rhomboid family intramembrane serine protease [Chitinophaga tropicalis]MVT07238.1 rhomboid family intramembrane serine protease [Chitinophaga tropicalis]